MTMQGTGASHARLANNSLRAHVAAILRRHREAVLLSTAGGLLLGGPTVHAQTAPTEAAPAEREEQGGVAEIIVTAQRRSQSVQSVPYNITAIDASAIQQSGASGLNDLTRVVSGLVTVDEGPGARGLTNNLTLRGLRTDSPGGGQLAAEQPGQTVNSVSTYFGETPVFFPIPMYDVDRVEVLRGPQGTLYGSGAQAGTIRFVPNRPDFNAFGADLQVKAGAVERAASFNNLEREVKGMVNLPLADHLALRLLGGVEHDPGFIRTVDLVERQGSGITAVPVPSIPGDLTSGPVIAPAQSNTNTANQWFARAALRWQPVQAVDLQVDYLHQQVNAANSQLSNPTYAGGPLDLTAPVGLAPGPGNLPHWPNSTFNLNPGSTYTSTQFVLTPDRTQTNLVSAVATVDLGLATVTSASSYYDIHSAGTTDWTPQIDNPAVINYNLYPPYNFYPRIVTVASVPATDRAFIQELRLASAGVHFLDYVVGAYYQREVASNGWDQYMPGITAYNAAIGTPNPTQFGDLVWNYGRSSLFQDRAAFGELTAHLTSAWQMTGGVRFFDQTFSINSHSDFYLCGAACASDQTNVQGATLTANSTSFSNHVWKWNTSYDISNSLKVYLTFSEGFRRGGANALPTAGPYASLPRYASYSPDLAKNYEVGIKGSFLDRKVVYTADIYRIDLSNFQFNAVDLSGIPGTYNGNTARSQGLEFDLQLKLMRNTTATLGYAYTDAKVTKTVSLYDYPSYALPAFGGTGQTVALFGGPIEAGSRLPGVPRNTITFGVDHTLPVPKLSSSWAIVLHADGAYRSSEAGNIQATSPYNWIIPSSFVGNARLSLEAGDHLTYSLFVNNFTNDPGYSGGNNDQGVPNYSLARFVIQPRTYGLSAHYHF